MNQDRQIIHVITGLADGGAEAMLYRLVMRDNDHQHVVVSMMDQSKYGPLLEAAGVEVVCLGMPQGRLTLKGVIRLWQLLQRKNPPVVQTWMYHADLVGGTIAYLVNVPRIIWGIHNTTLDSKKSRLSTRIVAKLNAWLSRWVPTLIVCCAERSREVHRVLGYTNKKMIAIPNGYDLTKFRPDTDARKILRMDWGVNASTPVVGMVGRFDPNKDHENLLRALGILKRRGVQFRAVLVGKDMDSNNAQISEWVTKNCLRDQVLMLGQRSDIPSVMNALDVHVLSSSAEAFPNVLAEAMACGTPCVTTDVGDASVIVDDTGWVVPTMSAEALADAIENALILRRDNSVRWSQIQRLARERIESNFSIEIVLKKYQIVWQGSEFRQ